MKFKVFISSVQREFMKERRAIAKLIRTDRLLRHFFEPYVFEETAATGKRAQKVYLDAVGGCDIYLGLIGEAYGNADAEGVSPTEREYDKAVACGKERLVFVKNPSESRSPEEGAFLDKISNDITWSPFTTIRSLEDAVYEALFAWLQGRDLVTDKPFDKSTSREVQMSDLDEEKFAAYIKLVREAKKVSLPNNVTSKDILTRIGAIDKKTGRITNGAIPLFAKHPEEIKPAWEIRCLHFYGTEVVKPIPSLHTYNGTVFELVDQALEFVMSRVDFMIGRRGGPTAAAPTKPEFPSDAIQEALVNAVCHRDYTSNACVQVMLFRDRLEIINPGSLPKGTTREDLYRVHDSNPRNEVIALAMSWTSYVEKSGSGTGEIIYKCRDHGLATPIYDPTEGFFKTIIWRNGYGPAAKRNPVAGPRRGTPSEGPSQGPKSGARVKGPERAQKKGPERAQKTGLRGPERVMLLVREKREVSTSEVAASFGKARASGGIKRILVALVEDCILETTSEKRARNRFQKYRLTAKGRRLAASLAKKK